MVKVNLGCGSNILEGFDNRDSDVNITQRLPYLDNSVDFILIEHCLEHVNCADGLKFLDEAYRILKKGGVLRVCVPVLYLIIPHNRNHARDLCLGHGHQNLYTQESLGQMLWCAGFEAWVATVRAECDGHWKVIGAEKDHMETLRIEATK